MTTRQLEPPPTLRFNRRALIRIRRERDVSVRKLARRLGHHHDHHVADWLNGHSEPGLGSIGRLARALDCDWRDLIAWSHEEPPHRRHVAQAEGALP
ncbi:helix-turn-helix protein [Haloactinospora alba]|uniref:XRE family transcriptional regulator n=2 Tax=Nocardiopsidaceae TaxID=83676 RepID=A0A3N0EA98_9ACTN|nr:helix-turn-helix transcriptional regulator [Haloactinospora alba]RNL84768.1 XRE family transcriptional regulator [Nocardiopsaceae bacterium YIM 96095]TQN30737.1 helix-turn-helix protein [Haloactinospora alba]